MDGLQGFLHRFKHLEAKEPKILATVSDILHKTVGVHVSTEYMVYQKRQIFLRVPPLVRQMVSIKKEEILTALKNSPFKEDVSDIR